MQKKNLSVSTRAVIGQLSGPYSKVCFSRKMFLKENFETYLKEKYANEEREQNTETDNPNFRVGS